MNLLVQPLEVHVVMFEEEIRRVLNQNRRNLRFITMFLLQTIDLINGEGLQRYLIPFIFWHLHCL